MLTSPVSKPGLTIYPSGSLRELWHISFPLMICLMSVSLMLFFDRLFLARYSLNALNAAANAAALTQFLQFWCIAIVSIAEVFVGRYNGAGRKEKLGQPVWQMIWLAVGTAGIYIPLGLFAGPYLFHHDLYKQLEIDYFSYLMCFVPIAALSTAIMSFYIGQGKVKFVTGVMLVSNLINIGLDACLIFGVDSWVPALGIKGAALATGVAQTFQMLVFFGAFLRSKNRRLFGTGRWRLNRRLFKSCFRMGLPNAVAHSLEILAWVLIFDLMTRLGSDFVTVVTIAQSILFLFTFMTEGLSKGVTAIASNLIGAHQSELLWKLFLSGVKFCLIVFILLAGLLVWHPDFLIRWFLPEAATLTPATHATIHDACFWVWLFFLFDGISWLLIGLLIAAGDTRFVMLVGGLGPLLLALLPIYLVVYQGGASAHITWMFIAFYALISGLIYFSRFKTEKWKVLALG